MFRIIARNAAANWFGFVVHAVVTFFLTPIVLGELGNAGYGMWAIINSLVGYYGLLDLGLRGSTTQYLSRYLSNRQYDKMNESVSSIFVVLCLIGTLLFTLSWLLGMIAPWWFDISPEMEAEFFWCIVILGGTAAAQCVFFPFQAVFTATQRYDIHNAIGVTARLISALVIWLILYLGYGLIGLSLAIAGCNIVECLVRWLIACQLLPQLRISRKLAAWNRFKELIGFAFWTFLIGAHDTIVRHTDVVLIGLFLPISEVTTYALAVSLSTYLVRLVGSGATVLYPVMVHLDAQNDVEGFRPLLIKSSRILFLASVVLGVIAFVWAEDFYRLWIGDESIGVEGVRSVAFLFRLLAISGVLGVLGRAPHQLLLGRRRVRVLASALTAHVMINILASIALIQLYGSVGVALGTLIAVVIHQSGLIPWITCRQLSIRLVSFYSQVCTRPLIVGLLLGLGSLAIQHQGTPAEWSQLFAHGAAASLLAMLLSVLIGITPSERYRIFRPLLDIVANRAAVNDGR